MEFKTLISCFMTLIIAGGNSAARSIELPIIPVTPSTESSADSSEESLIGDVNTDNSVNASDIVVLNKYLMSPVTYALKSETAYANADCDHDGQITTNDAMIILETVINS